jgi:hypothetical protein
MVGVTIGLRAFRGRAEFAARQFQWATGLDAVIVEDEDLPSIVDLIVRHCPASLPFAHFPYATKLFLFDMIDCERIVYFDADLLYVNRWDPTALDPEALHIVRDRWWNDGVQGDCRNWGLPFGHYFNAGFFILNRRLHLPLLRAAARSWGCHPSPLFDQSFLNGEAFRQKVSLNWMHRDYNLVGGDCTVEAGRFPIMGLHVGGGFAETAFPDIISKCQGRGLERVAFGGAKMGGTWIYERGSEQRSMEFWEDGMIGRGGAACEQYWRLWSEDGVPTLGVFGNSGGEALTTETFRAIRDGDVWRGRWARFEQNEVILRPD